MSIYKIKHACGYEGEQFLRGDKESIVLSCPRCWKGVTAHQIRDKKTLVTEKDDIYGVFARKSHG